MGKWTAERRDGHLSVDVGPTLKRQVQDAADHAEMTISAWIREVLADTFSVGAP